MTPGKRTPGGRGVTSLLACGAAIAAILAPAPSHAQESDCPAVVALRLEPGARRFVDLGYHLDPRAGVRSYRGRFEVSAGLSRAAEQGDFAPGDGTVRLQFDRPPPEGAPVAVACPLTPARAWRLGASAFGSLSAGESLAGLDGHRAWGGVVSLSAPVGGDWDIGVEGSAPGRQRLDAVVVDSAAEHRLLRDTFLSAVVGRVIWLGGRTQVVPVAGGGLALADSRRIGYALANRTVQATQVDDRVLAVALTAGVDLRFELRGGVRIVASYRLHGMAGADGAIAPRESIQHRPAAGLELDLGGS